MDDKSLPESFGEDLVGPPPPNPQRQDLARRLDEAFSMNGRAEKPSDWLYGAEFTIQNKLRGNPDWVAQAAHSLREILYPLLSPKVGGGQDSLKQFLTKYGSVQNLDLSLNKMGQMNGKVTALAHHKKRIDELEEKNFEALLAAFEGVMTEALERQLDVHAEIDKFFS